MQMACYLLEHPINHSVINILYSKYVLIDFLIPLQNEPPKKDEPVISAEVTKPESPKPSPKPKPPKETIELRTPTPTEKTPSEVHTAEEDASLGHSSSATFTKTGWSSHLPPSQSPTITLLQKARGTSILR